MADILDGIMNPTEPLPYLAQAQFRQGDAYLTDIDLYLIACDLQLYLHLSTMSWQGYHSSHTFLTRLFSSSFFTAYVDTNLVGSGKLVEAAILSLNDEGVWAISPGFKSKVHITPHIITPVVAHSPYRTVHDRRAKVPTNGSKSP